MKSYFSIEGNIGAGKSTFIEQLRQYFPNIQWIFEPIDEWRSIGTESYNILQHYYNEPKRWGFSFQMFVIATRINKLQAAFKKQTEKYIIMERSAETDKNVFSQLMNKLGYMSQMQWQMFNIAHSNKYDENHKIIYLKCSPQTCLKRIEQRRRPQQTTIPLQYLEKIGQLHEIWIKNIEKDTPERLLIIDTENDYRNQSNKKEIAYKINKFMRTQK